MISAKRVVEYLLVAVIVERKDSEASITSELVVSSSVANNILALYSVPKLHQILALFITLVQFYLEECLHPKWSLSLCHYCAPIV